MRDFIQFTESKEDDLKADIICMSLTIAFNADTYPVS